MQKTNLGIVDVNPAVERIRSRDEQKRRAEGGWVKNRRALRDF